MACRDDLKAIAATIARLNEELLAAKREQSRLCLQYLRQLHGLADGDEFVLSSREGLDIAIDTASIVEGTAFVVLSGFTKKRDGTLSNMRRYIDFNLG